MRKSIIRGTTLAAVGLLLAGNAARAEDYKIKLSRPYNVDDQYRVVSSATEKDSENATVGGKQQPPKNTEFTVELQGVVKVLAVNAKTGDETKISCKIEKLTKDGKDLYPAGTEITVEKTAHAEAFTIDATPVDAANMPPLQALFDLSSPDKTLSEDDVDGTDQPQKVGGAWPVNAAKAAEEAAEDGVPITSDVIKGEAKLTKVKNLNGKPVMVVDTDVTADGFKADMGNGVSVSDGKMHAQTTEVLPVDTTLPQLSAETKLTMSMTINLPGGQGTVLNTMEHTIKETREPVK